MNRLTKKLKILVQLDRQILKLLPEALLFVTFSYILLFFFPFQYVTPIMGKLMRTSHTDTTQHQALLSGISRAIQIISKYVPWEAACFVQAISAKIMLNRRGIDGTIFLGVKKEATKEMEGHAWLKSGVYFVTGKKGHKTFKILATYA